MKKNLNTIKIKTFKLILLNILIKIVLSKYCMFFSNKPNIYFLKTINFDSN